MGNMPSLGPSRAEAAGQQPSLIAVGKGARDSLVAKQSSSMGDGTSLRSRAADQLWSITELGLLHTNLAMGSSERIFVSR